ncbi:MAG TPA: 16S rRNA (cytidine(1402)-2'-O)-methyltransferase [Candidatus Cybelea sp.]|nr:16S rRNA (cytidine(1402)-2'-O)-methyltransferase [Candidatus Cybelea sp.]
MNAKRSLSRSASENPASGKPIDAPARSKPKPGLYLVATPIGNAADITLRALDILRGVDLIACEDTRVTGKLLARYGIATSMQPYHEHNAQRMRPVLLRRLSEGAAIALVSDAGTPLVSDPGFKLVRAAIDAGAAVTALPGPSAALAALSVAGLPTDRFFFAGFLPAKSAQRRRALSELAGIKATLVVLESAQRLGESLADMAAVLGPRPAAVARELTKLYEEVRRAPLPELAQHYAAAGPPKGEIVVVIGPPGEAEVEERDIDADLKAALARVSLKQAVADVTAASGLPRRVVYARALALANQRDG